MQAKALTTPAIFTGFASRVDGSLSFRGCTPELSTIERAQMMELQNLNVKLLIQPMDSEVEGLAEIKSEFDSKSPSQRLRGCLYRLWQYEKANNRCEISFDGFYLQFMQGFIDSVKDKLPEPQY